MENLYLKKIKLKDKEQVLDYIKELVLYGSKRDGLWYDECSSYEEMFNNLKKHEKMKFENYEQLDTPCTQFLLIRKDDEKMIGAVSVRPFLTKKLNDTFGGNIGYSIRPTERRKGYAKIALKLGIEECKKINPNSPIIVCCYRDNIGSKKTILFNGGILIEEKPGIIPHQKYKIEI